MDVNVQEPKMVGELLSIETPANRTDSHHKANISDDASVDFTSLVFSQLDAARTVGLEQHLPVVLSPGRIKTAIVVSNQPSECVRVVLKKRSPNASKRFK